MGKKIIIDLTYITNNPNTGVAKYALRFIEYLIKHHFEKEYCLLVNILAYDFFYEKYPQFELFVCGRKWMDKLGYLKKIAFAISFIRVTKSIKANLIFCPWANPINSLNTKQKKIATIHDVQIRIDSKNYKKRDVWLQNFADNNIVNHSYKVLTISEHSKAQILKYYPNAEGKLFNLSNCVSMNFSPNSYKITPGYKYILYVGRMDVMKNVITLVKAFDLIKDKYPDYKVVLVSSAWSYYEKVIEPFVIKKALKEKIVKINNCSESELSSWYLGASLFVFPSIREGFGFPPIEAAYMKIPVVSTKADSLEEVTLGLLNYYEPPTDFYSLAHVIEHCLNNPPQKEQLERIKDTYISHYSVDSFGSRIHSLLKEANL